GLGIPSVSEPLLSQYALVVGGTSASSLAEAGTDTTLQSIASLAIAGDARTLRNLVAGGLTALPQDATTIAAFIETTWNQYFYSADSQTLKGSYLENETGGGGIDTTQPEPAYQHAYGIDIASLSYNGQLLGRGEPDVAALAGGNTSYTVPGGDMTGLHYDGGTSASTPLWASLIAQIDTLFADQGLPALGDMNDLLYTAAAVAPASFNDVRLGNNISSFTFGGTVAAPYTIGSGDGKTTMTTTITPTGTGYSAGTGYDLTTGFGSPNGTLLARAMIQIAQARLHGSDTRLTTADGDRIVTSGVFLVQPHLGHGGTISLGDGTPVAIGPSDPLAWNDQLAGQSIQSGFSTDLVDRFDGASQDRVGEVHLAANAPVTIDIDGTTATASRSALTSPYGFVDYAVANGDSVTLARPVAIAQTTLGSDDQDATVRLRDNGADPHTMTFYRVDSLDGTVNGIAPGQIGYAAAAFSRAYLTTGGASEIATPAKDAQRDVTLTGINARDIIAAEMTDNGHQFWGFVNQNETVPTGGGIDHVYNYGMNTFGFEDTTGGGDRDYNDTVFQFDFTSKPAHGYPAGS
ncbi:MAG: DUF4114 domain-containing protein, partial [Janthinobacterium lividum]